MSPLRSSPRRSALGGIALAILFLTAQASTFTHRLLVQHLVCAEHGELVHAEPGHPIAAAGNGKEARALPEFPRDHSHDHCLSTLPRREDFLGEEPPNGLLAGLHALPNATPERVVPVVKGIALLRLAPKSSPPA